MTRRLYWRSIALATRRPYPFVIPGLVLLYCWRCFGWGDTPGSGYECPECKGRGYVLKG